MKKTTLILVLAMVAGTTAIAQQYEACTADATQLYYTTNAGWTQSEWYPILNIDAENLTPAATGLAAHTGADGTATSSAFSSGLFKTPVYNVDAEMNPVPTNLLWPVHYYMACLAPAFYNSAYTKIVINGATSWSGKGNTCFDNNNSIKQSPIWEKKGFIELSRQGAATEAPTTSRHGYIQLNELPQVERVQFSFSSTGWKRGFKLDIKHNDGAWEPLQWEPSDIASGLAGFSEQGYAFEVMINKQEDPSSKISLRWRIWDGDSIHANVTKTDGSTYSPTMTPYAQRQVARIHQIKIFSGVVPTEVPTATTPVYLNNVTAHFNGAEIVLSQVANAIVYSADGRICYEGRTGRIAASALTKGIYVVKMTDDEGNISRSKIRL
ncbi:MAG: T9SS type A sorting domain-containing protein [Bacteroidales bacterium]|nr:T9SS type A sorting domain-containing protein [Bacteroidales bacterium]ODT57435.1 MAG: hypothetical protein ABS72_00080 [Paludibacter sp. SCN 50-10]ODU61938.1 MAG: hypothetical protein ABT12_00155 [Paludibacter sp. SCN 51-9]OJX90959.1 MAG: hypothetical protein BGP01_11200 [Paludibacter sp. 47-17]